MSDTINTYGEKILNELEVIKLKVNELENAIKEAKEEFEESKKSLLERVNADLYGYEPRGLGVNYDADVSRVKVDEKVILECLKEMYKLD